MTVKDLGFFKEFPHGDAKGPSLLECAAKGDPRIQGSISKYLEGGSMLAATAQRVFDVLSEEKQDAGPLAIMTDGEWMWPAELAYYVRRYNISLPESFVAHARSLDWVAPSLTSAELLLIEAEMFPE
ncbi:hypothetical protein [Streptomyces globisporus]|uniref:hypothetical protein n=1 Tax=Streptomyces globisporus TaxID=1908 RepID=UPI000E2D0A2B|nr:hypothetical protein [Streptomyces sp. HB202]RDL08903.1 hypothetical protein DER30_2287 [Streptomyces sp. HB202]